MTWSRKYNWTRTWPDDVDRHGNPVQDYVADDAGQYAGRIYLDTQTLKMGTWRWCGSYPKGSRDYITPNNGWQPTAADAARTVEEYWDSMKGRIPPAL